MATTKGTSDGPKRQIQITPQRRGAGIILGIFTILFLMGTGAARRAQAQTYIVLHSFSGSDGAFPYAGLVRDSHGNLYGTTAEGGASTNCSNLDGTTGCGTVFKLDTSGTLTVLHSFDYSEGANPYGALVMDPSKGTLYGTTAEGGTSTNCSNLDGTTGCGTVFKLDTSGTLTVLHSFDKSDGARPDAGLVVDSHGNLYGTTEFGGSGNGTVFKLDNSGTLTVLHSFSGIDGENPQAGLLRDSAGNLYGTTNEGGTSTNCLTPDHTCGTVFELAPSGTLTLLHSFDKSDGARPDAGLVVDSSGNLYGTTDSGGAADALGTVFKLDTTGTLTVLHSFAGGTNDGANPDAGLVTDPSGTLYGTTVHGGTSTNCSNLNGTTGCGTVFKLDTSGTLTVLHSFDKSDGAKPYADLVRDSHGNFYGTTKLGGTSDDGTVFVLSTTPQGAIQFIINQVNGLLAQGVIDRQQDNSLVQELNLAFAMINDGKINDAIIDLESFITQVTALENSNVLTSDQATALINAANDVLSQIQ